MEIKKELLYTNYYKDANGRIIPQTFDNVEGPVEAVEFHSVIATVVDSYFLRDERGKFKKVLTGESSFSDDLALAIMEHKDLTLSQSIVAAAICCERCMNALAYEYDLDWGYPECSEEWIAAGTTCPFCEHMDEIAGVVEI
jgi:hypothetical protein